ncbi:MAG: hypothetical protein ASARMPRED_006397, partial [Alectoria sarmentosa]
MMNDEQVRIRDRILTNDGSRHEEYCTLCGVPFGLYMNYSFVFSSEPDPFWASDAFQDPHVLDLDGIQDSLVWASYFIALRIPKGTNKGRLTGIGQYDHRPLKGRIPPPGYDIRDVKKHQKPVRQRWLLMNEDERKEWEGFEPFYIPRDAQGDSIKSIYLIHPSCWDILLQQHALLASPTRTCLDFTELSMIFLQIPLGPIYDRFRPDWAVDYAGPERFFWIHPADQFPLDPEWHFLARDPGIVLGFDDLLANPPLEHDANLSPQIPFVDDAGEILSRLPVEILTEILVLLPSTSVRALQLASRTMASLHLSSRYWRSRFEFPNELCHVKLPPALQGSGRVGNRRVDWRRLCDQLLHPVGEEFEWWQNRKRIAALNKQFVKSLSLRRSDGRLKEGVNVQHLG